jgi:hypothetical protein
VIFRVKVAGCTEIEAEEIQRGRSDGVDADEKYRVSMYMENLRAFCECSAMENGRDLVSALKALTAKHGHSRLRAARSSYQDDSRDEVSSFKSSTGPSLKFPNNTRRSFSETKIARLDPTTAERSDLIDADVGCNIKGCRLRVSISFAGCMKNNLKDVGNRSGGSYRAVPFILEHSHGFDKDGEIHIVSKHLREDVIDEAKEIYVESLVTHPVIVRTLKK